MPFSIVEQRAKAPDKWDVGTYTDAQIAAASDQVAAMPGTPANANYVTVPWPVTLMPITAAALDFGNVQATTIAISDFAASQQWVKRDRLLWHVQHPGDRNDNGSPFVTMPITTEDGIIIDGHHSLTSLFLLGGPDLKVAVWLVPIGLSTGHLRGA